jgi:cyclopentanol dehydrogenase
MPGRLAGKVAIISGSARGQGATEGKLFAQEGAKVVLGDVIDTEGQRIAQEIEAAGGTAVYLHLDVSQEADWQQAIGTTLQQFGKLDILVNNAGILRIEGLEATTMEIWEQVFAVNQTGVFLGMKFAVPAMRAAGGGSIVNISSVAGLVGGGGATAYQASKGAVRIMTKSVATEYARDKIRVNSIHPGLITTQMVTEGVDPEGLKMLEQMTPLGRPGTTDEIANGALFLASDESSYMTGAELVLDGGMTAQ